MRLQLASPRRLFLLFLAAAVAVIVAHVFGVDTHHAWAAVGTGAVYLKNLPAPNTFRIDPTTFARETSRNRKKYPTVAPSGWGGSCGGKIDATGVVGRILLKVTFTLTGDGTAVPTTTNQWPWNVLKQVTVAANGINNLFSCDGLDLRALERVRNPFNFDRQSSYALPASASGTSNVTLYYEIPLAFDDESLMGAVFAQTQDTSLSWQVTFGATSDLFATHTPTISAIAVQATAEFYSIPYEDSGQGRLAIIPDLRRMHGFYSQVDALASTSYSKLMRVNGVLARVFQRGDNAANAAGDVDWGSLCTDHEFQYGSNVTPYDVDGGSQLRENQKDYGDLVIPAADVLSANTAPKYLVDDFVRDNALRDVVHLLGVTQPQYINVFSGLSVSNGNNSVVRTVQEHMIAGA